jgi:hypothetical protein
MRLTVLVLTLNSEKKLARILPDLVDVGDELVIGIDETNTDESPAVARRFTNKVHTVPHAAFFGRGREDDLNAVEYMLPYCSGDWVLRIDHDETLSALWHDPSYVASLLDDHAATHFSIPRRMVVPPGDRYISSGGWFPDYQLRLFRNIPSLIVFNRRPHKRPRIAGEQRFLSDSWIIHWKDDYAIFDEQTFETRPLSYVYPKPSPGGLHGGIQGPFCASIEVLDCPPIMRAGELEPVLVAITNRSDQVLRPASDFIRPASVFLSWHWYVAESNIIFKWEGARLELPRPLAPGECATHFMSVGAPPIPGDYLFQPDLVEELVAWFSATCHMPRHPVRVTRTGAAA